MQVSLNVAGPNMKTQHCARELAEGRLVIQRQVLLLKPMRDWQKGGGG